MAPVQIDDPNRLSAVRRASRSAQTQSSRLDRLTELASALAGAPVSIISLVDEDRQLFTSQTGLGEPWASAGGSPLSHSVCRTVVAREEPLVLDCLGKTSAFADHPARRDMDVESYCGVPIYDTDGQVLGSFCVIDHDEREWSDETLVMLRGLADLVMDSIADTIRLTGMVEDLQLRVLPETLESPAGGELVARYRQVPHTDAIGGDFFDTFRHPTGDVSLVIGDVVGHGLASTQAAAQLRAAALAVFSGDSSSPSGQLDRLAESCGGLPGCFMASVLIVRFAANRRTVKFARRGLMPPLVVRRGDNGALDRRACGPPIGIVTTPYDDAVVDLDGVEQILFFTDGLVERRAESLDVGLDRLGEALRDPQDLDDLVDAVCPTVHQTDDLAVVRYRADP